MDSASPFPPSQFPVLNPLTPMAYLPPDVARETMVAGNILVGTLAILIWDILNNFSSDYRLLTQYRIQLPTITYFLSRMSCLVYVLWSTIYYTGPIGNCYKNVKGLGTFYPISVSLSALLFFFRVRIVYEGKKWVVGIFFALWLCVVAGTLTVSFGVVGIQIGPSQYCLNNKVEDYVSAAAVVPLVYDTLVFLAITYRLASSSHIASAKNRGWWAAFSGDYLPGVSRALLKDGQTYYMVTVFSNLLTVVMIYMSSVPATYRTIFSAPNIMLINVMGCRVFRNTKFGAFQTSGFATSTVLATNIRNAAMLPVAFRHMVTGNEDGISDTIESTHGSGTFKTQLTPGSPNSPENIQFDTKQTADLSHQYRRSEHLNIAAGYPPVYPAIRKYSSSDSRF